MACGARLGLKQHSWLKRVVNYLWLNGLWSPFGFETMISTTVALVEGEEEVSPLGRLKKPQQLGQMGMQRGGCLLQHCNR